MKGTSSDVTETGRSRVEMVGSESGTVKNIKQMQMMAILLQSRGYHTTTSLQVFIQKRELANYTKSEVSVSSGLCPPYRFSWFALGWPSSKLMSSQSLLDQRHLSLSMDMHITSRFSGVVCSSTSKWYVSHICTLILSKGFFVSKMRYAACEQLGRSLQEKVSITLRNRFPPSLQNSGMFAIAKEWEKTLYSADLVKLRRMESFYRSMHAVQFASAHEEIRSKGDKPYWASFLWEAKLHPRTATIGWKIMSGAVNTDDRMQSMKFRLASSCIACKDNTNTQSHTFYECGFARQCWNYTTNTFAMQQILGSHTEFVEVGANLDPQAKARWGELLSRV
ncbi:hypothetical protein IFM89_005457 [Coptis chinensis]|uniref:Reverse transcriptase zinc-binding domain-containing protein n=1 Tax=Coptis chinensis TaxID=261450 RepID=A0A835IAL3_9MAGN|nr:hypothetical protein IFM89_005457 [Coptis chinensis]